MEKENIFLFLYTTSLSFFSFSRFFFFFHCLLDTLTHNPASLGSERPEITLRTLFVPTHYITLEHVTSHHTHSKAPARTERACTEIHDMKVKYCHHEVAFYTKPNHRLGLRGFSFSIKLTFN